MLMLHGKKIALSYENFVVYYAVDKHDSPRANFKLAGKHALDLVQNIPFGNMKCWWIRDETRDPDANLPFLYL